jgi:hypothetical protein
MNMSVTFTAATILIQNGMTETDFLDETVEYMMDDAIDTVNLLFTQDIAALAGSAGAKTATMTRGQSAVTKMLLTLVLRENKKTQLTSSDSTSNASGASGSISAGGLSMSESSSISTGISASAAINNPANSVYVELFMQAGNKLVPADVSVKEPPIYVGNAVYL